MDTIASRELKVEIIGDSRSLQRALGKASDSTSKFGSSFSKAAKVVGVAAVGVGAAVTAGFVYTLKRGFDELAESQKVTAQTVAGIKSTGAAANVTAKDVEDLAVSLSQLSGVDDEVIQQGENLLLTFTNVRNEVGKGNDVFNRATAAALDLSVRGFGSMDSTSKMLGKALQDPIKGMSALGRAGVTFTAGQKATIKSLVDSGQALEAQKLILSEVERQVGGSAKAYGETLPGQLAKARNSFDEIAANLAVKFLPMLTSILEWVNANWPQISAVIDAVGTAIIATFDAIGATVDWLRNQWEIHRQSVTAAWNAVQDAVMNVINWFKANVVPAIQNVISAAQAIWNNFGGEIKAITGRIVDTVKAWLQNMLAPFKIFFALLRGDWSAAWEELRGVVTRTLGGAIDNAKALLSAAASVLGTLAAKIGSAVLDGIIDGVKGIGAKFRDSLINPVVNALKEAATTAAQFAAKIVLGIIEPFTHLPSFLGAPFRAAKDAINKQLGIIEGDAGGKASQVGFTIGQFLGAGLGAGITASIVANINAVVGAVYQIEAAARAAAKAKSPSKLMAELGRDLMLGIAQGLADETASTKDKAAQHMGEVLNIAEMIKAKGYALGNAQVQAVIEGVIGKTPSLKQQLMTAIDEANAAAVERIAAAKQGFADALGQLAQAGLAAFDAKVAGWENPLRKKLEAEALQEQADKLTADINTAADKMAAAQAGMPPLKLGEIPTEEWKKAEADFLAAKAEYDAAVKAQQDFANQQEIARIDAQHAMVIAAQRQNLTDELNEVIAWIQKHPKQWELGQKKIIAVFKKYGIEYRTAGKALGEEFAKGIKDGIAAVGSAVEELAEAIAKKLKGRSPPPEGPLKDIDRWGGRLVQAFLGGLRFGRGSFTRIESDLKAWKDSMLAAFTGDTSATTFTLEGSGKNPFEGKDDMLRPSWADPNVWASAVSMATTVGKLSELLETVGPGGSSRTNARLLDLMFQNRSRWNWNEMGWPVSMILDLMRSEMLSGAEAAARFGLATGGVTTADGWRFLHNKEAVIPLDRYTKAPNRGGGVVVNINNPIGGMSRTQADAVAAEVESAFARRQQRTGTLAFS